MSSSGRMRVREDLLARAAQPDQHQPGPGAAIRSAISRSSPGRASRNFDGSAPAIFSVGQAPRRAGPSRSSVARSTVQVDR